MGRWATSPAEELALARFYQFMGTGLALLLAGTLLLGWNHARPDRGIWSFDLIELSAVPVAPALSSLVFFLLFYGLAIRTPLFPLHGWLPLVAEHGNVAVAPVFLLGLKVGIYGLLRFVFPLVPEAVTAMERLCDRLRDRRHLLCGPAGPDADQPAAPARLRGGEPHQRAGHRARPRAVSASLACRALFMTGRLPRTRTTLLTALRPPPDHRVAFFGRPVHRRHPAPGFDAVT